MPWPRASRAEPQADSSLKSLKETRPEEKKAQASEEGQNLGRNPGSFWRLKAELARAMRCLTWLRCLSFEQHLCKAVGDANLDSESLLGGSWVVRSGVTSRVTIIITHIRGFITPLIATHEAPSKLWRRVVAVFLCAKSHLTLGSTCFTTLALGGVVGASGLLGSAIGA